MERVSTQVHTRKLDRAVANNIMKAKGMKGFRKHENRMMQNAFGMVYTEYIPSTFTTKWIEYCDLGLMGAK